ncbi:nucleoside 2-deoxyribosyltransferase domain-containing protein [Methanobrevibacter sp.]
MKVFLGGTINGSKWRDEIMPKLKIDYFNPVVEIWDDEARLRENHEKEICDWLLFVITPMMAGVYSIAEVVDLSNKSPEKTLLCILDEDGGETWSECQKKSLDAVETLVEQNGAMVLNGLDEVIVHLNSNV